MIFFLEKLGQLEDILDKYGLADGTELDLVLNAYFTAASKITPELLGELKELADIQNKLGISLNTLFKALNGHIWFKFRYGKEHILKGKPYNFTKEQFTVIDVNEEGMPAQYIMSYTDCRFKDYGKTWALTKEELL